MNIETESERADALAALLSGHFPDERGRYGPFGGRYVPETLIPAHERLERGVRRWLADREFRAELERELHDWVGRPTALSPVPHLSRRWGAKVWLKREDLAHTGAHKINNAIGQALLARRLGARRVVAETGAGQHGVASAAACARVGLPCTVYMGELDMERQAPNVGRMKLLGAKVVPVTSGDRTLRAAIDEALRDWVGDPNGTYYLLGSAVGGHPYPYLVRELQSVIGREARAQIQERAGGLPDAVVACVGGGSNSIGLFHAFSAMRPSRSSASRPAAAARGSAITPRASRPADRACCTAAISYLLQETDGQIQETHSISAGLDYPGVGLSIRCCRRSAASAMCRPATTEALEAVQGMLRMRGHPAGARKRPCAGGGASAGRPSIRRARS